MPCIYCRFADQRILYVLAGVVVYSKMLWIWGTSPVLGEQTRVAAGCFQSRFTAVFRGTKFPGLHARRDAAYQRYFGQTADQTSNPCQIGIPETWPICFSRFCSLAGIKEHITRSNNGQTADVTLLRTVTETNVWILYWFRSFAAIHKHGAPHISIHVVYKKVGLKSCFNHLRLFLSSLIYLKFKRLKWTLPGLNMKIAESIYK